MGSPFNPCSQLSSHGLLHTRPQIAGNGLLSLITSTASSNLLLAIRFIYALTFIPAGHAFEHSGLSLNLIIYFLLSIISLLSLFPINDFALIISLFLSCFFRSNPQT
jgi:hypothetical protein